MEKVWIVLQESNVDGETITNATPCADYKTAKSVMDEEIDTLLSSGKYEGLDLDEIEKDQDDDADYDFILERDNMSFYLAFKYDDYYEYIKIEEKEIVKKV